MRFVTFHDVGGLRFGAVSGDEVVDLNAADPRIPASLSGFLRGGGDLAGLKALSASAKAAHRRPLASIRYGLPVGDPGTIFCLGLNYLLHIKEGTNAVPDHPTIFMRGRNSLVAHKSAIIRPKASDKLDYEAELALVIGKPARHLTLDNALECIAGYACFNDGSLRDFQRRTTQWTLGKNFDRTGGFGPFLVTPDELPEGAKGMKIESRLNGKVMQSDTTANMMFPVAVTLAAISEAITLEPGDVVAMGTPSGVGYARTPPVFMKPGDVCEIEIEGVGVLSNPIEDEL
jgi:2-keto-4-pentenoate hydratase/2-oxohepta-3-ene-1,7-dioic acid hydratase in catechol pathway